MIKPKIKLVDFNPKKSNLQDTGHNGQGIPNGRIVVTIQEGDKNGYISNAIWNWECSYDNFVLGTHEEHDETWGDFAEHRKLGGTFPNGFNATKFYFTVSRMYAKGSEILDLSWKFEWTLATGFVEIIESSPVPTPVPVPDCEKYKSEIVKLKVNIERITQMVLGLNEEIKELKSVKIWKFFKAFNPKLWDWKGLWSRIKINVIVAIVFFILGIII